MTDIRQALETCTLERYETEFADRHLLHGVIAKLRERAAEEVERLRAAGLWDRR